jgi:hypothetical protein
MAEFTCSNCGESVRGDECPRCRAATAIATPEHAEQAKLTPPASTDGTFREGDPPLPQPPEKEPWPYKHEPGPWLSPSSIGCSVVGIMSVTAICLMVPSVSKYHIASVRIEAINNMKQIALACHNHQDANKHLPAPRMSAVKDGKEHDVQLSWRVALLPFVEANPLFNAFDLSTGWDHPNNAPFEDQMPSVYTCPYREEVAPTRMTHFQYFTGPDTLFPDNAGRKIQEIPDGSWNTFLFAEADKGVVWSQPADMAIRPGQPLPLPADRFLAAMADATVRMISRDTTSDAILRQLINPNDGKPAPGWDAD